jgi:transcriptional regulator with XRE-family HTH domain
MVTEIRRGTKLHYYISEHMADKGFDDEKLAGRLGVRRETVNRWRNDRRGVKRQRVVQIADAMGMAPEELTRPPSRPSLDALVSDKSDDVVRRLADALTSLLKIG